jgi:uncharacterized membrane protein
VSATTHDDVEPDDIDEAAATEAAVDRWAGTEHERAGGASRGYALLLVVAGVLGTVAAATLNIEYIHKLIDPDAALACDLNPFITCGDFLGTPQSSAFGFPNVVIGMICFPVVVTTGVLLLAGIRLPRWYWRGLLAGTLFGVAFVTWLQYQALFSIRAICPWCALVWAVMIPLFVHTVARCTQNGALPAGPGARSLLVQYRWVLTALWWLVVAGVAFIALADRWSSLF